ncbi:hypothetical protein V2J09_010916 [Rumex salicifolius]
MSSPPPEAVPSPPAVDNATPPTSPPPPAPLSPSYSPPPGNMTAQQSSSGMAGSTLTALGVGAGLGGLIVLVAVGIFVFFYKRKKRKMLDDAGLPIKQNYFPALSQMWQQNPPQPDNMVSQLPHGPDSVPVHISSGDAIGSDQPVSGESLGCSISTFSYEELARITDNFSSANLLGQGGFGYVHKGVLPNGTEVAIKQLKPGSGQGEREFRAEIDTISRVDHRNLVILHGLCISGDQRLLVYEYVPNKTMEFHLHGEGRPPLSWSTRLKIAIGAAKGLAYLHEDCQPKIIHRDIKASNILLDNNFEAKVADFGLAKFSYDTDTHVSTRVMGTFGYLAPEYASSGKLTEKSDVFSFGIVLLELITGRRPIDKAHSFMDDSMVEWARPLLVRAIETGNFDGLVDPKLEDHNISEMTQMVACANVCVRQSARRRPRMSQVVRALEGNLTIDDLCKEKSPESSGVHGSSDYDHSQQYKDNLTKFRKLVLESQDQSTSEFSAIASEYDAQPSTSSTEDHHNTRDFGKSEKQATDIREVPIF